MMMSQLSLHTSNQVADLLNMPFHIVKTQYDLLVKDFEDRKKREEEEEKKAKSQQSSYSMPSMPKMPSIPKH